MDTTKDLTTKVDTIRDLTTNKEDTHHNNDMTTTNREATTSTKENKEDPTAKNVSPVWVLWHAAAVFVTVFSDHIHELYLNLFSAYLKIDFEGIFI